MAENRVRVLWLAKGLGQGGMERLLVTHAKFGDRERFDYRAAFLVDRPHSVIQELEALDVPVTRLGSGNPADPRWIWDLAALVRRERIDVVHMHSPLPASVARPLLRLVSRQTRLVYTEHNRWDRFSKPTRWANRITYRLSDTAFAVSEDCRESMSTGARERTEVLIHGIDVEAVAAHRADRADMRAELGVDEDTVVIGTVANLRPQKNYPMLLEVASRLTSERDDVLFVAAGQGPLEVELNQVHNRLELGEGFRFLGFREDVHRVMSSFDVFCLSSDHEGLPVALMEAKALGLPVVATAVGGVTAAVSELEDGLLVPPRDREALRIALERLTADSALRLRLAESSRGGADRYRASRGLVRLEKAYRSPRRG